MYGESSVVGGVVENSGFVSHFDRVPLSPPKKIVKLAIANENSDPLFCSCRDIEYGNMVCCDNGELYILMVSLPVCRTDKNTQGKMVLSRM